MNDHPEPAAMARMMVAQYGTQAKSEARRRWNIAIARTDLEDAMRWKLADESRSGR